MSIQHAFCGALGRLARNERGHVAILFAFGAIPLLLLMGGAVDFARQTRHKMQLANAVDSAALALARQGPDYTEAEATAFVEQYAAALMPENDSFTVNGYHVEKVPNGYTVTATGSMQTRFLSLGDLTVTKQGATSLPVDILSQVMHGGQRVELALVFDNTGSMNCGAVVSSSCTKKWSNPGSSSRLAGLKGAAAQLVDTLMPAGRTDPDAVKIALVPFEGTVNVGVDTDDPPSWIAWSDRAQTTYEGVNFDSYDFGGSIGRQRVGHKFLFDKLTAKDPSVKWAGCVEMRAEPYDILDTVPTSSDPDTLYVPFFWPDEPDSASTVGRSGATRNNNDGDYYSNDYLNDINAFTYAADAQKSLTKFTSSSQQWHSGLKDTAFPFESGPNFGCPRPILPLTNDRSAVESAIDGMIAYPAMGTYIPTGLVWGWHVLSPGEPFTQGVKPGDEHYKDTIKAMVLLSDGENSVTGVRNHNSSIFSAYNYTGTIVNGRHRLGSANASVAEANLNDKTADLCENVKGAGIRLYTITFGDIVQTAKDLMRNCASTDSSGEALYYHAPDNADLADVFASIGKDLTDIRLSM